ncbi:MAG: hypothetical protein H6734_01565 [Alphaproteobacteria bacterium]|nr:hypothetical protein [Alphaproteobacteria bacterium]
MRRLVTLPLVLLGLTACFDFAGDRGELGFLTDARLDLHTAWTPAYALAEGTSPRLAVGEILATGQEPKHVQLSVDGGPAREDVVLDGHGRAVVTAEADGVRDRFVARWRPVEALQVGRMLGEDLEEVGVLPGVPSPLGIGLRDRRGRPLGFRLADLDLDGTADVWEDDGLVLVATDTEASVTIGFADLTASVTLVPVDPETIELTVERLEHDGRCLLVARASSEGLPVLDPGPVRWSHTSETSAYAECGEDVRVARAGAPR